MPLDGHVVIRVMHINLMVLTVSIIQDNLVDVIQVHDDHNLQQVKATKINFVRIQSVINHVGEAFLHC